MYRTVAQCCDYLHKIGEESITKYFIRNLAKSGKIQVINANTKALISLTSLLDYLGLKYLEVE